jgi:hypothetical protein
MSRENRIGAFRWMLACFVLAAPAQGAPARKTDDSKAKTDKTKPTDQEQPAAAPTPRPIRLVANEVIKKALLAAPSDTARRISVKGGLVGLGAYSARGGDGFGTNAPPRYLFPQAGTGNSLNVDPMTGRSYFTNTP